MKHETEHNKERIPTCEECYQALREIRAYLDDETLDDKECFWRIERIVEILEAHGSDGGSRHDF